MEAVSPPTDLLRSEVEERFLKILRHARRLGLTAEQLTSLESIDVLRDADASGTPSRWRSWMVRGLYLVVAVKVIVVLMWMVQSPVSRMDLVAFFFRLDVETQPCLVSVDSASIISLVRPPVSCSVCRNQSTVDRVARISRESFESKYAYSGRPVVITDATRDWTAPAAFSFEFFRGIYAEDSPVLTTNDNNCQFFPYKTNFQNLSEVFRMSAERANMLDGSEPWYIGWSNCDSFAANILRTHYTRPYFLPDGAESSKTDWIFMGTPGYGANKHIDNVMFPSWQAQVTGTKLWTLEPPPECYFECESQIQVQVRPGEIIVLDTNKWFHSTLIMGKQISITIGSEYD